MKKFISEQVSAFPNPDNQEIYQAYLPYFQDQYLEYKENQKRIALETENEKKENERQEIELKQQQKAEEAALLEKQKQEAEEAALLEKHMKKEEPSFFEGKN